MSHVMLSYQWDKQALVKKVYEALQSQGIAVWMDIHGGMSGNINDSMAAGVDNAAVVCPFITAKYQESKNCKKELNYADARDVPIVPAMAELKFKATGWLGIITAGLLWMDFRRDEAFDNSIVSLTKEIIHAAGDKLKIGQASPSQPPALKVDLKKKPGRAFRHSQLGKFLAESGEVKHHQASGSRSTLVLRDTPEDTSYWEESKLEPKSEIHYFRNYQTKQYLGYDPNGDYIYTKGQHYGAEEWLLISDEESTDGRRAVVIFAKFGQRYLAIRNGKLTGVANKGPDCVWYLD
uniref:TIR domain-containing protein n=3 Tax=Macrostomum lignano TaxID=282301 RepID=A0A1I8GCP2_9PLAT